MIGKLRLIFWIGIVLLFLPYFGLPDTWKSVLTIILGILVIYIAIKLKHTYKKMKFQMRHIDELENTIHE